MKKRFYLTKNSKIKIFGYYFKNNYNKKKLLVSYLKQISGKQ